MHTGGREQGKNITEWTRIYSPAPDWNQAVLSRVVSRALDPPTFLNALMYLD